MNNKITIGIPRALLYYKYNVLWQSFFKELGIDTLISPETNYEILENGKKNTMSEACLSMKIYVGHVDYLKDKVDYILVPRIVSLEKGMKLCTNFSALYDILNNTFDINILNYNIDVDKGITEELAFIKMGQELGFGKILSLNAYKAAKKEEYKQNKINYLLQEKRLNRNKTKVLLVCHTYNSNDNLVGKLVTDNLKEFGVDVIYADIINPDGDRLLYKNISKALYWTYNQELLNSIEEYKDKVDGIIFLSTFPCGPDSLVNEMCSHKIDKKMITILIDELSTIEGLQTRLESFIDILRKDRFYE
ncbi:MAG: hypothetical protein J6B64_00785 [Bacilli bacterium]|nr:hypothetical protein [Bacilli bacterium]MBP3635407.1 hypothetical protein [Bacilli bacterium]